MLHQQALLHLQNGDEGEVQAVHRQRRLVRILVWKGAPLQQALLNHDPDDRDLADRRG